MNHVPLKSLPPAHAWSEINDGKLWLEDILGRGVISFCYPRGKFNSRVAGMVKEAGFLGARTCLLNLSKFPRDPFSWGVSTHAGAYTRLVQVRHALLEQNYVGARNYFYTYKGSTEWPRHFLYALDDVQARGGIAHLYLHSWEIADQGNWGELQFIFQSICERGNLTKVTNGALFEIWKGRHHEPESN